MKRTYIKYRYYGITYPQFLCKSWILNLWRRFLCKRNMHLFDECFSSKHYLSCDACDLMVHIDSIETTYMNCIDKEQ